MVGVLVGDQHRVRAVDRLRVGEHPRVDHDHRPSCSNRTQACPNFVIRMPTSLDTPVELALRALFRNPESQLNATRRADSTSPAGRLNESGGEVVDVAPAPVLAGLGGLHDGVRGVVEVGGGVAARRGVAAADVAAVEALAQRDPGRARRAGTRRTRGRLAVSTAGLSSRWSQVSPVRRTRPSRLRISSRLCWLMSSIDSSTSSIASTSLMTSLATCPELADLQHPLALGIDHLQPHPGVELARASPGRPSVPSRSQAAKLRCSMRCLSSVEDARAGRRTPARGAA